MSPRTRLAIGFVSLAALITGAFVLASRYRPKDASPPLTAAQLVPARAQLALTVNLTQLRASPYASWLGPQTLPTLFAQKPGCAEPLVQQMQQLAVWSSEDLQDIGVVATGSFSAEAFLSCAQQSMTQRGGTPQQSQRDGFTLLADNRLGPKAAQLAVRAPGLVLLGPETPRNQMMDVAQGKLPGLATQSAHAQMRAYLGQADVLVSARLSPVAREQLERMLQMPLPVLSSVQGIAAALDLGPQTKLRLALWCETAQQCAALSGLLKDRQPGWSESPVLKLLGIESWAKELRIEQQDNRVLLQAEHPSQEVLALLEKLDKGIEPPKARPGNLGPSQPLRGPDELLEPGKPVRPKAMPRH